jgi:pilin isopeptide linkage protein
MFKLAAVTADAPLPEETTVTATSDNRSPSFGDVTYSEEGTYEYKITEIEGSIAGITYDLSDHTAVVKVERGNDGKLHVTATYDGDDSLTVKNSYRAASTDIAFSGTKTLIGRTLEDKQFTFAVYDENENEVAVGMNDASGKITFGSIKYTETGTYNYTIKELGEDGNGITTDKNVRKVTVIVSDNGNGKLDAVLADDSDSITFNNIYQAEDTHVQFRGIKTLEGKKLKDGEFCFILKDKDTGRTLQTVRNDAEGNIIFKEITYSRAGKYTYTISESADEENGVIFDSTVYEVTVTVTDDGNGQLTAEVSGAAADGSGLDFTNKYETVSIKAE